ncbi:MAG: hypothetical protein ACYDH5_20150 [Acidimicrobiales bacterium]
MVDATFLTPLVAGSVLALVAGLVHSTAAAIEKSEGMAVTPSKTGFRLLAVLAGRRLWLSAMALGTLGWVAEAAALALAPMAAVAPLMAAGRALLVVLGVRFLGERFDRLQLLAVGVASAGGALAALSVPATSVSRVALPASEQVLIGVAALSAAGVLALASRRTGNGVGYGAAAGLLFAATGVYTKEVSDRFATHGLHAVLLLAASPSPWGLIALSAVAQSFLQTAFRRDNAASVSAASSAVSLIGLVVAGFVAYHQPYPAGSAGVLLAVGIAAAGLGGVMLGRSAAAPASRTGASGGTGSSPGEQAGDC